MSNNLLAESRPGTFPVCDLCHSRKVRCDRRNPCGNCQDADTSCERLRAMKRRLPRARSQGGYSRSSSRSLRQQSPDRHPMGVNSSPDHVPPTARPMPYRMLTLREPQTRVFHARISDAQMTIQYQLCHLPGLSSHRQRVLETALSIIRTMNNSSPSVQNHDNQQGEACSRIPSTEFLTWMLKDIHNDRLGSFAADYFRHISMSTLKQMSLSLLREEVSTHDFIIYSVCLNSVAYKFMTVMINIEQDPDLILELRKNATEYRATAQAVLKHIPQLVRSSFGLLQALLCGVFLYRESGDVDLCGDLIKAACNTCTDLDLSAKVFNGSATEEELFCFLWCYTLDRNHAFTLRTPRYLLNVQLPSNLNDLYPLYPPGAELFAIYLDLVRVQDTVVSYLRDSSMSHHNTTLQYTTQEHMLLQMQAIDRRINEIASLSSEWKGLDSRTEMLALRFAYQSVMTEVLYQIQADPSRSTLPTDDYLQSARQELSALISMVHSAKQTAVSFLNRTIIFYPITAYLVVFCNAAATSDIGDFNLLNAIVNCLAQSETTTSLVQLHTLFTELFNSARGVFNDEGGVIQGISSPHLESPWSHPAENPLALTWDVNDMVFDQFIFTGLENYFDTTDIQETDLSLPFNNSSFE